MVAVGPGRDRMWETAPQHHALYIPKDRWLWRRQTGVPGPRLCADCSVVLSPSGNHLEKQIMVGKRAGRKEGIWGEDGRLPESNWSHNIL